MCSGLCECGGLERTFLDALDSCKATATLRYREVPNLEKTFDEFEKLEIPDNLAM